MGEFVRVGKFSDFADGGKKIVEVDDRMVVIVRVGDSAYCIDDVCTHDGGTLGEGKLTGYHLACPRHGAKFDVRDGRVICMPATEPTFAHEVKVEGGDIFVRLNPNAE